jgi:hypothetical protein
VESEAFQLNHACKLDSKWGASNDVYESAADSLKRAGEVCCKAGFENHKLCKVPSVFSLLARLPGPQALSGINLQAGCLALAVRIPIGLR